jgi:tetratricopeptide (TPR) repeat protein
MTKLIYLIFSISYISASTITLSRVGEGSSELNILNVQSDSNLSCNIVNSATLNDKIECSVASSDSNISRSNKFFDLELSGDTLVIYPKSKYKIFYKDEEIYNKRLYKSQVSHYNSIELIFFKAIPEDYDLKGSSDFLDFDIQYSKSSDLIDVLGDDLNPVIHADSAGKIEYIQKLFDDKKYQSVIDSCDRFLKNRPLFKGELILYKLRAMDKLLESGSSRVDFSNAIFDLNVDSYIEQFPSDINMPEMLYFKSKIAFKGLSTTKAIPYVDRLSNNFPDSIFTHRAQMLQAIHLYKKDSTKQQAIKIFKDLLYKTPYKDIALKAAYNLMKIYAKDGNDAKATIYLKKIVNSMPSYLLKNLKQSYSIAKNFAKLGNFESAVNIVKHIFEDSDNQPLHKNYAIWLEKLGRYKESYKIYKRYLDKFPNGIYLDVVKKGMDRVLLDTNDTNITKQLADIKDIMKSYRGDSIYKKALIKKVNLYDSQNRYSDILNLKQELEDINESSYLDSAATKLFIKSIGKKDCKKSIYLRDEYNITLDLEYSYELVKCYLKWARYDRAYSVVSKNLNKVSVDSKSKWLYLGIRVSNKVKKYQTSIDMYNDLIKLVDINNSRYSDISYTLFDSYEKLDRVPEAIKIANFIEKRYPKNPENIDLYHKIVLYSNVKKDDMTLQLYAIKLLELQKELDIQRYSPKVDIVLIQSLRRSSRYKKALSYFADALLDKSLDDKPKAQLLYLAGDISLKLNNKEQAREFFIKCGVDIKSGIWQKLCADSLRLLDDSF